jgi:FtsP/CotA-like multicopper oxidase with cupredoxin domain
MRWILAVVVLLDLGVAAAVQAVTAPLAAPGSQARSFTLYVREGWVPLPDGGQVYVWGFTDDPHGPPQVPGPPIVVNEGDTVEVTLVNDRDPTASERLPVGEGHTIHLHGLDVPTEHDGVPETHAAGLVRQGSRYTYRFVASHAGTYWYHCHQNNVEHQQMGMYGPVIVRAAGGARTAYTGGPAFDREQTLVLAEMGLAGHEQARLAAKAGGEPYNWLGYAPDVAFTNAQAHGRDGDVWAGGAGRPGERVLVRAINAGYVVHHLHAHGQPVQVVASDGRPWPQGPTTDSVWLGPGERYDLLVTADASGRVALHDHLAEVAPPPRASAPAAAAAPTGRTRQYILYVRETVQTMPDGVEVYSYGFTDDPAGPGQVPGPALQAAEGDAVEVTLVNDRDPTGRGHALAVPALSVPVDGPRRVAPGESGTYRFLAGRAGSYLYGSPDAGDRQMGLYGALVVTPADGARRVFGDGPSFDEQYTMVLSEVDAPGHAATRAALRGGGAPYDWAASAPNYFLINGRAYPDTERDPASMVHAQPGARVLLRAVNAGQRPHAMHLHGYHFHVVDVDGRPLPGWPAKDVVLIWPGESANLLFVADQPGRYPFHDHFEVANTNDGVWLGGMHTMVATGVEHAMAAPPASALAPPAATAPTSATTPTAAVASGAAAADAALTMFIRDNYYTPAQLTVPAGSTVVWRHEGQVEHTVSSLLGYFDSGPLTNGAVFTHTFTTPGRYDFFCRFHITNRGTIVVE